VSCYEAGWEGFWLARWLEKQGIKNYVLDSASIEVSRKSKHKKTDRVDAEKLMNQLLRYETGERTALTVVRVPSDESEDLRHLHRERDVLVKERGRHWVRIKSLLRCQGLRVTSKVKFVEQLQHLTRWDDSPVPAELTAEIEREWRRYELVSGQVKAMEKLQKDRVAALGDTPYKMISQLMQLKSVGWQSAWILVMEFFAWRQFRNGRQVASLSGLTPTPYNSGESVREQGISKAGNRRIRKLMIELGWMWLRNQPNSTLTRWYQERFAHGGKRQRRIGIVALARKLLVALWRYIENGEIPAGAVLKG
jgi:transposase